MVIETDDRAAFRVTQRELVDPFSSARSPRTVLVVPSMTLDSAGLVKIPGVNHYEERFLVFLQLLRDPAVRVVFVTSEPIADAVVDYSLGLFGCTRERLTMLDCGSRDPIPLTGKVLRRPDLLAALRALDPSVLVAFNGSPQERALAVRLGVPLFAADPDLAGLGSKTGSRRLFAEAGVPVAPGFDGLRDTGDVVAALADLRAADPTVGSAIVKLNDSFGAGGNVVFSFDGAPGTGLADWVRRELPGRAVFASPPDSWEDYAAKVDEMGAVVERFVTADETTSPSAQVLLVDGAARVLSTHDQVLAGAEKQIFVGCTFPSRAEYRTQVQDMALRAGTALAGAGVSGIASVDFVSARTGSTWRHFGLEVNLRMGGGTAPFLMLRGLVPGEYDPGTAEFRAEDGTPRSYFATDRVLRPEYRALRPADLIGVLDTERFDAESRTGAAGYMLSAVEIGRFGVVYVDRDTALATAGYRRVVAGVDALV